jgi:hypothetical protein
VPAVPTNTVIYVDGAQAAPEELGPSLPGAG